jgi:hypothetical protein
MVDAGVLEPLGGRTGELHAGAADVTGDDIVAIEAVLVDPGVQQQVTITRA